MRGRPLGSLVDRVVAPGGGNVYTTHPEQLVRVMSPQTANELRALLPEAWHLAAKALRVSEDA